MALENQKNKHDCVFEIKPNCSLSHEGMIIFFLAIAFVSFLLALRFWLLGAWLVMPFFVLEVTILGVALYLLARSSHYSEVIKMTANPISITIKQGKQELNKDTFQQS